MVTNALSPMRIIEELGDLVRPGGTIAIMSSSMGSVRAGTKRRVGSLSRQQGGSEYPDAILCRSTRSRWTKPGLGRSRMGPDGYGRIGRKY